jgi:hypothetical protein
VFSPISEGFKERFVQHYPRGESAHNQRQSNQRRQPPQQKAEGDCERQQHAARLQRPGATEQTRHEIAPTEDGAGEKGQGFERYDNYLP